MVLALDSSHRGAQRAQVAYTLDGSKAGDSTAAAAGVHSLEAVVLAGWEVAGILVGRAVVGLVEEHQEGMVGWGSMERILELEQRRTGEEDEHSWRDSWGPRVAGCTAELERTSVDQR